MTTKLKGLIFNIQKFSVHDGPGIRTTVFLKGCPLSCAWCSNPESQKSTPELMTRDIHCRACGACVRACPKGAISLSKNRACNRSEKCDACLLCVDVCLYDSLLRCGMFMSVGEVLDEVLQDRIFYKNSGGGVTLSGGEPLAQPEFACEFLAACKRGGLNTAVETAGVATWDIMKRMIEFVDLVLFDVKHLDNDLHRKTTGVGNELILENLRRIATNQVRLWLRVPLIAGFNDSESHIRQIANLGVEIGVEKISLLPYHEGGKTKSDQLGTDYAYPQGRAPARQHIKKLEQIIEKAGMAVTVGN